MTYINVSKFVLINELEKDHSIIETRRLKNVLIFIQTIIHLYWYVSQLDPMFALYLCLCVYLKRKQSTSKISRRALDLSKLTLCCIKHTVRSLWY